jgi:chromate reductase, NAD(P)H dehydrogenase (quinone)
MKVLTLCGSLRAASLNAALLRTVARVSPSHMDVLPCTGIGDLPLFNPDLSESLPDSVVHVHTQIAWADALVIASPEYANAITGVIKNLLDWLVGFEPFQQKAVAVINAAPRARMADAALKAALQGMSANLVHAACIDVPLINELTTELEMVRQPVIAHPLQAALRTLQQHVLVRDMQRIPEHILVP